MSASVAVAGNAHSHSHSHSSSSSEQSSSSSSSSPSSSSSSSSCCSFPSHSHSPSSFSVYSKSSAASFSPASLPGVLPKKKSSRGKEITNATIDSSKNTSNNNSSSNNTVSNMHRPTHIGLCADDHDYLNDKLHDTSLTNIVGAAAIHGQGVCPAEVCTEPINMNIVVIDTECNEKIILHSISADMVSATSTEDNKITSTATTPPPPVVVSASLIEENKEEQYLEEWEERQRTQKRSLQQGLRYSEDTEGTHGNTVKTNTIKQNESIDFKQEEHNTSKNVSEDAETPLSHAHPLPFLDYGAVLQNANNKCTTKVITPCHKPDLTPLKITVVPSLTEVSEKEQNQINESADESTSPLTVRLNNSAQEPINFDRSMDRNKTQSNVNYNKGSNAMCIAESNENNPCSLISIHDAENSKNSVLCRCSSLM